MVFRFISERSGFIGRIVVGLVGMGWTLATYLAVPVLVTQNVGPIDAVKESAGLFKRTWGEQMVGNFGMGWACRPHGPVLARGVGRPRLAGRPDRPGGGRAAPWAWPCSGFCFLALFSSALKGIYTAALYRYATTGEAGVFAPDMVRNAFRTKR